VPFSSRGLPRGSEAILRGWSRAIAKQSALRDNARMFYVYILENSEDKSWYIGYSANLKQRIERH
jgi:hypothetical protein